MSQGNLAGYRTITALSLGLRPRESGLLSPIIPQNHGIAITYIYTIVTYVEIAM